MIFDELPEFQRDLRQLLKKYRSLVEDLAVLKKVLSSSSTKHPQPPLSFRITSLGFEIPPIIKIKKFACKSLKGKGANTGLRIMYAYHEQRQVVEFIQIYSKAEHANEDTRRIIKHFASSGLS
jgi:mRNA-degrading endonuclease RelE of RelBE toxin-antitoxin system